MAYPWAIRAFTVYITARRFQNTLVRGHVGYFFREAAKSRISGEADIAWKDLLNSSVSIILAPSRMCSLYTKRVPVLFLPSPLIVSIHTMSPLALLRLHSRAAEYSWTR